jgi:hypothetical protein
MNAMTDIDYSGTLAGVNPKVLLLATYAWPVAARLIAGFADCGLDVDILCPLGHAARGSSRIGRVFSYYALTSRRSLRAAIASSRPALIVPCDDRAVLELLALYDESKRDRESPLAALIERSLGNPKILPMLMSRAEFIAFARDLGIAAPELRAVGSERDLSRAIGEIGMPLVMKRDHTTGGTGVHVTRSRDDAMATFRDWSRHDAGISVQRFIDGRPATTSLAAWKGKLLAANHFDVLETERPFGPSSVVRRIDSDEMTAAAERIAGAAGLSGLFGLDYMRGRDGAVHLIEINTRATTTGSLAFGAGNDLLAALAGCMPGGRSAARAPSIRGDVVALFPYELLRDPQSAHLKTAYHDIPTSDRGVKASLLVELERRRMLRAVRRFVKRMMSRAAAVAIVQKSPL